MVTISPELTPLTLIVGVESVLGVEAGELNAKPLGVLGAVVSRT